jgi:probable HAF family extracellular repeat protein
MIAACHRARSPALHAAIAALLASAGSRAVAQCMYDVTVIDGSPECQYDLAPVAVTGMNEHGHLVGYWSQCDDYDPEAFVWRRDTGFTTLPRPPGFVGARAYDINDSGMIVGALLTAGSLWNACVWCGDDVINLDPLLEGNSSEALAINNAGQVTGYRNHTVLGGTHGFVWEDGVVTDLSSTIDAAKSRCFGINEDGAVTGWRCVAGTPFWAFTGFVWKDGVVTADLGPIPGGTSSEPRAINNRGDVVGWGWIDFPNSAHAFLWRDGTMHDLEALPTFQHSIALDINDDGRVIGYCDQSAVAIQTGFIWSAGERMRDIRTVMPPTRLILQTPGAIPAAINNQDQIAVYSSTLLTPRPSRMGDLDCDGAVGFVDLLMLTSHWGPCIGCPTDIDGDGEVNVPDLLLLLGNWNG